MTNNELVTSNLSTAAYHAAEAATYARFAADEVDVPHAPKDISKHPVDWSEDEHRQMLARSHEIERRTAIRSAAGRLHALKQELDRLAAGGSR